jgi:dihydrolipoamide dehydrogenase
MPAKIKTYDVIVIGSGSGTSIVDAALGQGLSVALVDKGPLGGTCANVGCIPSKMLTVPADRIMEIREASRLGITADVQHVDFAAIMERMRRPRAHTQHQMREALQHTHDLGFYEVEGHFVDSHTLQVGKRQIRGDRIFVVAGARPVIPPAPGLDQVDYLTNDSVFDLAERPDSMVIIGGGYIACELGHFFAAVGTDVTLVQRNERLVPAEEPEISQLLQQKMSERMRVLTSTEVVGVRQEGQGIVVVGQDRRTGAQVQLSGQRILVAAGRQSNADLLEVQNAGIKTDPRGYIQVNEYLETNVPNVWAFGDVIGKHMFKHTANREAVIAWHNSQHDHKVPMDYHAVPHAVFAYPQIASVGLTEAAARVDHQILVGRARYDDVAYGMALVEEDGFAKAVVDAESEAILGFHIIGPHAAILIQEVINAMAIGGPAVELGRGLHTHPALSEVVLSALNNLAPAE